MEKLSLLDFRQRHNLTQQELAARLNVSRNYIALVENGKKPFSDKLKAKLSLVNNLKPPNSPLPRAGPEACPRCLELEKEIVWLKDQVAGLVTALAAKPIHHATPAYGAGGGGYNEGRRDHA